MHTASVLVGVRQVLGNCGVETGLAGRHGPSAAARAAAVAV